MHELAVCQDIISQVENIATQHEAVSVASIELLIGPLSGIEKALLESAFPIASAGTVAEKASLIIEELPIKVFCDQCNKESTVTSNNLTCQYCSNWKTQLVSGDEMLLKRLELDT